MLLISVSCLYALARTSSTMLNTNESEHLCFGSDLRSKALSLSPLSKMLALRVLVDTLYQIEEVLLYSYFSKSF